MPPGALVVLGLLDKDSLVAAHPHDCGSSVQDGGRTVSEERDVTVEDLKETFVKRPSNSYNEWVLKNYTVRGIFAVPPFRVSVLKVLNYPYDVPEWMKDQKPILDFGYVTVPQLLATFHDHSIFSFCDGKLVRLTEEGVVPFDHTVIY